MRNGGTIMNIGFIGFGEAAFNIAQGLYGEGIQGIKAHDAMQNHEVMGKLVHKRAEEAHVTLVDDSKDLVDWADVVFAAVPSTFTMGVCDEIKGHLRKGQLYVDVSASTPATKQAIWEKIKNTGVLFADAAMLGSLPKKKHQVPITASGNGAAAFKETMTPYHMDITLAGEKAGSASAIKLVRSIFMKGIASLMIEMLEGAHAYGVADEVVNSLSKSLDGTPFVSHLNRLVTGTGVHAKRRGHELEGSIDLLKDAGVEPLMTTAAKASHEMLVPFDFAEKFVDAAPTKWEQIVDPLLEEAEKRKK